MKIDAQNLHYKELNQKIKQAAAEGEKDFELVNICGHRYIGCGVNSPINVHIEGIPGNDLGAFMSGPILHCSGNAQDGIGNTMDAGRVVVPGHAGDVMGYAMRGGEIYIRGNAGYRIGIHMKSYGAQEPVVIIGGRVRDFCGEYLAGGKVIVLGLDVRPGEPVVGKYCATGMHGGTIYVRGEVPAGHVREGIAVEAADEDDYAELRTLLADYCTAFHLNLDELLQSSFTRLKPFTTRPYGQLYAY